MATLILAAVAGAETPTDVADLSLESLLDNVVIAASKHQETLEESPANVYVISRAMIEDYGCRSIKEALSLAPGIYITDDYSLTQIGVRGVSMFGDWNTHVMILIDGRPTNEQYGGSSTLDAIGLTIDHIERIEVIKGPASTLYGSNAFLGTINLITRQYGENTAEVSGRYYRGIDDRSTGIGFHHRFDRDWTLTLTGSTTDRRGHDLFFPEFSDPDDSSLLRLDDEGYNQYYLSASDFTGGWSRNLNTLRDYSTHGRLQWRNLGLTTHFARTETGVAHSMWGSLFQRPENRYLESRGYADLDYTGRLSERIGFFARLSYNSYAFNDYILYNYASLSTAPDYLPGPIWRDHEYDRCLSTEIRCDVDFGEKHRLILGSEAQFHRTGQSSGPTASDGEAIAEEVILPEHQRSDGRIYNLYVQDEYRLSRRLKLVSGMHFNYYTYTSGRLVPKAAAIVTPYAGGTYKLIVSQGFRSPSFYELTFDDGEFYYRNPDLRSELITHYELIASHTFHYGLSLDISAGSSRITNMIQQTRLEPDDPAHPGGTYTSEVSQFQNSGRIRVNHLEWAVRTSPIYRWSGFANTTWQEATVENGAGVRQPAFNSPRWLVNFGLVCRLVEDRVSLSARTHFGSSCLLWDGSRCDQTWVSDLMVTLHDLIGGLDVGAGVKNLFDEDYRAPLSFDYAPSTSISQPGRSLYLTARLNRGW